MQKVIRGVGSLSRLPELTEKLGIKKPLIVTGSRLHQTLTQAVPSLAAMPVFSGYQPNPEWDDCAPAWEMYQREGCDGLISLGGGSAMDTAKAIKARLLTGGDGTKALQLLFEDRSLPHIAIPATAGTGAEATPFAVMYLQGVKHSLSHPCLLPEGTILDASLLKTLPEYHKKSCALDALCQGIESFWAKGATEDSRVDAYLAILGVLDNIKAYLQGDEKAAEAMLDAAWRSGKAIAVSRTTAAHAMSYGLAKQLGYAHGHACALTLPHLWQHMLQNEELLATLMELSGIIRMGSDLMGPKLILGLLIELDLLPKEIPDEAVIDRLSQSVNAERLGNHPEKLTQQQLKDIYRQAFRPLSPMEKQVCLDLWRYYGES